MSYESEGSAVLIKEAEFHIWVNMAWNRNRVYRKAICSII